MSRNRYRFHSVLVVRSTARSTLSRPPPRAAFSFRMRLRDSLLGVLSAVVMLVTYSGTRDRIKEIRYMKFKGESQQDSGQILGIPQKGPYFRTQ